jgi:VCBS repeat-containing protein
VQPAVQITNPKAGSTGKGTVSISAKVSGAIGASNTFTFQVDNTVLSTKTVNGTSASTSWNAKQTGGGKHTLTVTVTGSNITEPAGNTGSASEQVTAR